MKTPRGLLLLAALTVFFVPSLVFGYEGAPVALTDLPTFVTEKSAQANGHVNPNEMKDTFEWFEWGIVGRSEIYETNHEHLWGGSWQTNTNSILTGLAPSTQYFYRQVAENARGRDVGQWVYVTTKPLQSDALPFAVTTTNDAVLITDQSATLRGYVSPQGNAKTVVWFEWGVTVNMENATPRQENWGSSGYIETRLDGLRPGTAYYFRAVAENSGKRTYGALKVFSTRAYTVVSGEAPRDQSVASPVSASQDSTFRTETTNGAVGAPDINANNLPQARNRPGDFFSILFGGQKNTRTSPSGDANGNQGENGRVDEIAGVGAAFSDGGSLKLLSGTKPIEVAYGKIGPENAPIHTPIEYKIAYAYRRDVTVDAKLKVTLPNEVVYIGDNTNNELLLDTTPGKERTYVLPLGHIESGATRTISVLGMTTGDAKGFPDIVLWLEYTDVNGNAIAIPGAYIRPTGAKVNVAAVVSARSGVLPSTPLGWLLYAVVVVGAIFGVRKAKEYYTKRKESLASVELSARADEETEQEPLKGEPPAFLPGAREVVPLRAS